MEILNEAPKATSFIPLVEHQSTTPVSFYTGPPVLHYYSDRSKVVVLARELTNSPALTAFAKDAQQELPADGEAVNGDSAHETVAESQQLIVDVDIWVTSDKLLLYGNKSQTGVSIPYPMIALHAIQSLPEPAAGEQQGVYMQLVSSRIDSAAAEEDIEPESISITLIPTASAPPAPAQDNPLATEDRPEQTPVVALFTALSDCSNLHPDPAEEGDEDEDGSRLMHTGMAIPGNADGGLPPPMPGSGGWITAENMHEYIDEEGNWIEDETIEDGEALGPGAGTVRPRDDEEQHNEPAGSADETKWQRTG